jgi:hypothetical protein
VQYREVAECCGEAKINDRGGEVGDEGLEEGDGAGVDQDVHLLRPTGPVHRRGWTEKREHDGGATLLPTRYDAARSVVASIHVDRHRDCHQICRTRCHLSGEDLSGEEEGEEEGGALVDAREGRWCRPLDLRREEGCSYSMRGGSEEGEARRGRAPAGWAAGVTGEAEGRGRQWIRVQGSFYTKQTQSEPSIR